MKWLTMRRLDARLALLLGAFALTYLPALHLTDWQRDTARNAIILLGWALVKQWKRRVERLLPPAHRRRGSDGPR